MHVKTGDTVVVRAGKSKGVKGKVLSVSPKTNKVVVEGVNIVTKHQKPQGPQKPGGISKRESEIHASNVNLFCQKCNRGVRVSYKVLDNGKKVRVCAKCKVELDK